MSRRRADRATKVGEISGAHLPLYYVYRVLRVASRAPARIRERFRNGSVTVPRNRCDTETKRSPNFGGGTKRSAAAAAARTDGRTIRARDPRAVGGRGRHRAASIARAACQPPTDPRPSARGARRLRRVLKIRTQHTIAHGRGVSSPRAHIDHLPPPPPPRYRFRPTTARAVAASPAVPPERIVSCVHNNNIAAEQMFATAKNPL